MCLPVQWKMGLATPLNNPNALVHCLTHWPRPGDFWTILDNFVVSYQLNWLQTTQNDICHMKATFFSTNFALNFIFGSLKPCVYNLSTLTPFCYNSVNQSSRDMISNGLGLRLRL